MTSDDNQKNDLCMTINGKLSKSLQCDWSHRNPLFAFMIINPQLPVDQLSSQKALTLWLVPSITTFNPKKDLHTDIRLWIQVPWSSEHILRKGLSKFTWHRLVTRTANCGGILVNQTQMRERLPREGSDWPYSRQKINVGAEFFTVLPRFLKSPL